MRSIQAVNEVGRERRALFGGINLRLDIRIADINALHRRDELFSLDFPIWLYDR